MKTRLTERKIEAMKPKAQRYEVRDEGVQGLILRVGKKGEKIWEVVVSRAGKRRRVRLGRYPDLLVPAARAAAQAAKDDALGIASLSDVKTVSRLFEKYRAAREGQRRSWRDVQSAWDNWAKDRIGHLRLSDLTIHHGLDLRNYVAAKSTPLRAGAVIRYIRPMFAWAADEQYLEANPWVSLKAGEIPLPRDRVLSISEARAVWDATFDEPDPLGPFVRALMLSAQRIGNVASMRWDEIDGDLWTIPREKMKATKARSAKAHEVPICEELRKLIEARPRIGDYVFTTTGRGPIKPGSRLKDRIGKRVGFTDWVFHDLRRTGTTLMTLNGVPQFIAARVLGHTQQTVTAIYDKSEYRDEKRHALSVLQAALMPASPVSSNVVEIRHGG
ncbi:site-specific integrase [uncultured Litoreibacter sp.]|uniref:tyrosine-type recombinase/integrase n=1 Tax=uncultured Litoreibacter sp. TaxID=1392394 RepID=UPI002608B84A|nr:site-specific integrase [uncultured Litoreibacter sp.]